MFAMIPLQQARNAMDRGCLIYLGRAGATSSTRVESSDIFKLPILWKARRRWLYAEAVILENLLLGHMGTPASQNHYQLHARLHWIPYAVEAADMEPKALPATGLQRDGGGAECRVRAARPPCDGARR